MSLKIPPTHAEYTACHAGLPSTHPYPVLCPASLNHMDGINWFFCSLAFGRIWPMGDSGRRMGRERGRVFIPQFVLCHLEDSSENVPHFLGPQLLPLGYSSLGFQTPFPPLASGPWLAKGLGGAGLTTL